MKKYCISLAIMLLSLHSLSAQTIDTAAYAHLLKADKQTFITYAEGAGMEVIEDTASQMLFAKMPGCLYIKPLNTKSDNEGYDFVFAISSQDKNNNAIVLKNATEMPDHKGTWKNGAYMYKEWEMENPISQEMWYKVFIFKKKK